MPPPPTCLCRLLGWPSWLESKWPTTFDCLVGQPHRGRPDALKACMACKPMKMNYPWAWDFILGYPRLSRHYLNQRETYDIMMIPCIFPWGHEDQGLWSSSTWQSRAIPKDQMTMNGQTTANLSSGKFAHIASYKSLKSRHSTKAHLPQSFTYMPQQQLTCNTSKSSETWDPTCKLSQQLSWLDGYGLHEKCWETTSTTSKWLDLLTLHLQLWAKHSVMLTLWVILEDHLAHIPHINHHNPSLGRAMWQHDFKTSMAGCKLACKCLQAVYVS